MHTLSLLRVGNLVRHKAGGPIMMVDWASQTWQRQVCCVWVENRQKQAANFDAASLQAVYGDGSPRMYPRED
jgi:uncharacterized protein YodC (DUF2158 family)